MIDAHWAVKIALEVPLFAVTFAASTWFWNAVKHNALKRRLSRDDAFLSRFLTDQDLRRFADALEPVLGGWEENFSLTERVNNQAIGCTSLPALAGLLAVAIASFFLSWWLLLINGGLFALTATNGLGPAGRQNALGDLLGRAAIMLRWKESGDRSYEELLVRNSDLRPLDRVLADFTRPDA